VTAERARPGPVFEAIRTVLAVREYADRQVPVGVITTILESARLTASSRNGQPWHFVLVRERGRLQELGRMVRTGPYLAQAAFAVVCAAEKTSPFGVSDLSRAIQSMVLAAWEEGVGSNWTGFGGMDAVRRFVELPESVDVLAVVAFGYPARPVGLGRKKRRELREVVSLERAGQPYDAHP
jgi:nitroreductase